MKSEVKVSGNRMQLIRQFNAPRPLVFSYWTQAEKLRQWSGCKAATRCEIDMDFRVGGPDEFFCQTVSGGTSESFEKLDSLLFAYA